MGQENEGQNAEGVAMTSWNPIQHLREVDPQVVRYSRGFLRSRPERWFPGFTAQWAPLAHSLGVEVKCAEIKPVIEAPRGHEFGYVASVDDELIAVVFDRAAASVMANGLVPNSKPAAQNIAIEYAVRRFVQSLALAWSGGQSSVISFEPGMSADSVRETGAIKLTVALNGNQFVVWVLIGKMLVERFDGLWRRQLLANSAQRSGTVRLVVELAHLTVPPTELANYLVSGTDIDLEISVGSNAALVIDGEPAFKAELVRAGDSFALEVMPGAVASSQLPEGTNRLSVQLTALDMDANILTELSQQGAMLDTGVKLTDEIALSVGGEVVGRGKMRVYQGRLAITVL